jgi:hypothetical protein
LKHYHFACQETQIKVLRGDAWWLQHSAAIHTLKKHLDLRLLRWKVAMAAVEGVPALEELSLVNVCGERCMPGDETNLGELLLTAANTTSENVCLEVEAESYTFAQVRQTCESLFTFKIMISVHFFLPFSNRALIHHAFSESGHVPCQTMPAGFMHLSLHVSKSRSVLQHGLMPN